MLSFIGDMAGNISNPVEGIEGLEVTFEGGIELGMVNDLVFKRD